MMRYALAALVLLASCSKDSTGLTGTDPTVLITNQMPADTVFFTWRDGQGIVGTDTVLANHTFCAKFVARPDSAYFQVVVNYHAPNLNTYVSTLTADWFNPLETDGWTVDVTLSGGGANIVNRSTSPNLPC